MPENRKDQGGAKEPSGGEGTTPAGNRGDRDNEGITRRTGDTGQQRGDDRAGDQGQRERPREGNRGKGDGGGGGGSQTINEPSQGKSQNGSSRGA